VNPRLDTSPNGRLTFHNYVSAATGIASGGCPGTRIARHTAKTIENFSVILSRINLYLLLPICVGVRLFLFAGVIQNFNPTTGEPR